jgi:signal transduction histidine kinase
LREFAESRAERTGVELDLDLPEGTKLAPPEIEQCFYRIGQEAIENTINHSQARSLKVVLSYAGPGLRLEIIDDGCGFDPKTVDGERHLGLQGMRERAEVIGADTNIFSEAGKGTRVTLLWAEQVCQGGDG